MARITFKIYWGEGWKQEFDQGKKGFQEPAEAFGMVLAVMGIQM